MTTVTVRSNTFSDEAFAAHLSHCAASSAPQWLAERKRTAWEQFQSLPMPVRSDEKWRFTNLQKLTLKGFDVAPQEAASAELKQQALQEAALVKEVAGSLTFVNGELVGQADISAELKAKGVLWLPLAEAIVQHPELVQKYLFTETSLLGGEKFRALHQALVHAGSFLFVPKGVVIDAPFIVSHFTHGKGRMIFPHTLILAEDNAQVHYLDLYASLDNEPAFAIGEGAVYAARGAHIERQFVQDLNPASQCIQFEAAVAERDSRIKETAINLGCQYARGESHMRLVGEGSDVHMYSLAVGRKDQEFDQRTLQIHEAAHATSDLLYKNALREKSRTIFSGLIKVEKDAQQTDAYQTNRNLLLSNEAEANSLPGLEIEANDVKCSHGATTAQIDPAELFYLYSRGIDKPTAYELLVFGFFEEVLTKIEHEELRESIRERVRTHFHR